MERKGKRNEGGAGEVLISFTQGWWHVDKAVDYV